MFSVVQQRTYPSPSNASEEVVYRAIEGLRRALGAWASLLEAADPDPVQMDELAGDIRHRTRQLARSCRRLARRSPFRYDPTAEGLYLAQAALETAQSHSPAAVDALDIEHDTADLQELAASLTLARALSRIRNEADRTVRNIASEVGISHGYWSELEGAKAGFPTTDLLGRIENVLGEELRHLIRDAEATAKELRRRGSQRRAQAGRRQRTTTPDQQIQTIVDRLARDDDLLDFVTKLLTLKPEAQRAVEVLVNEAAK